MKKTYRLERFGTIWVLIHNNSKAQIPLKTTEMLIHHINRWRLVNEIDGLSTLSAFHREQIGYVVEPVPICDVVINILQDSGFTNPALIS